VTWEFNCIAEIMNDPKAIIRYVDYHSLQNGGRGFDFSFARGADTPTAITIEVSVTLFEGADRIAIQEVPGICYETLKSRMQMNPMSSDGFDLTPADVAQHRKITIGKAGIDGYY
jgi:hypothetical protein